LLASVWSRRTAHAVLAVYLLGGGLLAGLWLAGLDAWMGLLSFLEPQNQLIGRAWAGAGALAALAGACVLCLALAAWRLRPAHDAQAAGAAWGESLLRTQEHPAIANAPMRWKEHYAGELGLFSFLRRLPYRVKLGSVTLLSLLAGVAIHGNDSAVVVHGLALILVTGLVVGMRASSVITAEREKRTWEGLLLTPLEPDQLVRGKLWGIIDSMRPYLLAYLLPGLGVALLGGLWPTFCLIYCWLGTWAFLYHMGAYGLYWSAKSAGSWQSLFQMLSSTAARLSLLYLLTWVLVLALSISCAVGGVFFFFYSSLSPNFEACIILMVTLTPPLLYLFAETEGFLQQAAEYIDLNERGGKVEITMGSLVTRLRERAQAEAGAR
jgi:hypothetical protein